jgi:hypothetical protein
VSKRTAPGAFTRKSPESHTLSELSFSFSLNPHLHAGMDTYSIRYSDYQGACRTHCSISREIIAQTPHNRVSQYILEEIERSMKAEGTAVGNERWNAMVPLIKLALQHELFQEA